MIYDCIIVGDSLGGLMTAGILARRGKRVLVMRAPWSPPGPHPPLPWPTGPLASLFERVKLRDSFVPEQADEWLTQVVLPGHSLDVARDRPRLMVELRREFGADANAAETWLADMESRGRADLELFNQLPQLFVDGFFKRRAVKKHLDVLFSRVPESPAIPVEGQPDWMRALLAPLHWISPAPELLPPWAQRATIALAYGGFSAGEQLEPRLRKEIGERVTQTKGKTVEERGDGIAVSGKKAQGVLWDQGRHSFPARCVIWADRFDSLAAVLPEKMRRHEYFRTLENQTVSHLLVHERVLFRARVLPVSFRGRMVVLDGPHGGPLLIRGEMNEAEQAANTGNVVLALTYRMAPTGAAGDRDKALGTARDAAWKALRTAIPFCDEGVVRERTLGDPFLWPVRLPQPDAAAGVTAVSARTPVENLYLHSPDVWPALGAAGEFLLTPQVAAAIDETLAE